MCKQGVRYSETIKVYICQKNSDVLLDTVVRHYYGTVYNYFTGVICRNNQATNGLNGLLGIYTSYIYGLLVSMYIYYCIHYINCIYYIYYTKLL